MITVSDIVLVWIVSMGATGLLYLGGIVSPVVARVCDKVGEAGDRFLARVCDPVLKRFGLDSNEETEGD